MLVDLGPMRTALQVSGTLLVVAVVLVLLIAIAERRTSCRRGMPTVPDHPGRLVDGRVPGIRTRQHLTRGERRIAAADVVDLLAGDGLWCELVDRKTTVRAHGPVGEYLLTVDPADVTVTHWGPDGVLHLGRYPSTYVAAQALTAHAAAT